jgi:SAM-dependent methyltransferase
MKVFASRWDFVGPLTEGKEVLEVGPAELVGTVNRDKRARWIHGRIAEVAKRLVGIDVNREQVEALRSEGFDVRFGDAESFELEEKFDVIVAGELIEHLSNPGLFLDRARAHLSPGGTLVLTTPNRYRFHSVLAVLKSGAHPRYKKPMAKHVAYFDSDCLTSLLQRHGFGNIHISYCKWVGGPARSSRKRAFVAVVARLRPAMLSTMVATATPERTKRAGSNRHLNALLPVATLQMWARHLELTPL